MPTDVQEFISKKELPRFIKNNSYIKTLKQADKIFPKIGLENFSKKTSVDPINIDKLIIALYSDIRYALQDALYYNNNAIQCKELKKIIESFLKISRKKIISSYIDSKKLTIGSDIYHNKKILFKANFSLFKLYNYIYEKLLEKKLRPLPRLESFNSFKAFSAANIPSNLEVVFSSSGVDGFWDLATISMRGIDSCQSWNGQYKECLIGTLLDPYTGVIYLTSNSPTPYGTKMIKRSLVRFLSHKETGEQCILIDKMYPSHDDSVLNEFKACIADKLKNKNIKIYSTLDTKFIRNLCIPKSDITKELLKFSQNAPKNSDDSIVNSRPYLNSHKILSYRDTLIDYSLDRSFDKQWKILLNDIKLFSNEEILYFLHDNSNFSIQSKVEIANFIIDSVFQDLENIKIYDETDLRRKCFLSFLRKKKEIFNSLISKYQFTSSKEKKQNPYLLANCKNYGKSIDGADINSFFNDKLLNCAYSLLKKGCFPKKKNVISKKSKKSTKVS